jgi:hypothetical protein
VQLAQEPPVLQALPVPQELLEVLEVLEEREVHFHHSK